MNGIRALISIFEKVYIFKIYLVFNTYLFIEKGGLKTPKLVNFMVDIDDIEEFDKRVEKAGFSNRTEALITFIRLVNQEKIDIKKIVLLEGKKVG